MSRQPVGRVSHDDVGLVMAHQPNKTSHHRHDRAPTERVSPRWYRVAVRHSRVGVAELDEVVHPQRDGGEVEFAGAQRGHLLRIVARMARFFAMRPVALAAVGAGNQDRAPASGSVSGQSAAGLARFVVRVGMHHHQYRNLRHCPIIAHRRPRG